jgi:hypothetical protein
VRVAEVVPDAVRSADPSQRLDLLQRVAQAVRALLLNALTSARRSSAVDQRSTVIRMVPAPLRWVGPPRLTANAVKVSRVFFSSPKAPGMASSAAATAVAAANRFLIVTLSLLA